MSARACVLFAAGRYDAATEHAAYLDDRLTYMAAGPGLPHAVGTTEAYTWSDYLKVKKVLKRWGYRTVRRDEYVTGWLPKHLRRTPGTGLVRRMSNVYSGPDEWRDADMATLKFIHRATGTPVKIDLNHLPSGVEQGTAYRGGKQTEAHKAAVAKWGRIVRRRPKHVVTIGMPDTNVHHGATEWRHRMEKGLGLTSLWSHTPPVGTHRNPGTQRGARCIDSIYTSTRITDGGALPWPKVGRLDHRAVWATVTIPTKEKKR